MRTPPSPLRSSAKLSSVIALHLGGCIAAALFSSCSTAPESESRAARLITLSQQELDPSPDQPGKGLDGPVYDLADVQPRPVPVRRAPPRAPKGIRAAEALVAFVVDKRGETVNVHTVSSNSPEFAAAAEEAVRQWVFRPGMKNGQPVNTSMAAPLTTEVYD